MVKINGDIQAVFSSINTEDAECLERVVEAVTIVEFKKLLDRRSSL